jgi:hypothetical protein
LTQTVSSATTATMLVSQSSGGQTASSGSLPLLTQLRAVSYSSETLSSGSSSLVDNLALSRVLTSQSSAGSTAAAVAGDGFSALTGLDKVSLDRFFSVL